MHLCGRCVRLTTYHHPVPLSRNLGTLTSWNPLGLSRSVMRLIYLYVHLYRHSFRKFKFLLVFVSSLTAPVAIIRNVPDIYHHFD